MIAFLMHLSWQLDNGLCLDAGFQRGACIDSFEVGACGFGVFANPVRDVSGCRNGSHGHHLLQINVFVATEVKRGWH